MADQGAGKPDRLTSSGLALIASRQSTIAVELSGNGIRVNALSLGIVPTEFFVNSNAPEELYNYFEQMADKNPLRRLD